MTCRPNSKCPGRGAVHHGDNVAVLRELPRHSCTAMVTDPPGGIATLGLDFERSLGPAYSRSLLRTFKAARRVLQPGALCVVWSYPLTLGWMQLALINAGLELTAIVPWINAEGRRPTKGSLAPGCEFWIVARTPGPRRPLYLARWRVGMFEGREPRGLVLGCGVGPAIDRLVRVGECGRGGAAARARIHRHRQQCASGCRYAGEARLAAGRCNLSMPDQRVRK